MNAHLNSLHGEAPGQAEPLRRLRRHLAQASLGGLLTRSVRRFPHRTALIDAARRLTYRELDEASNRFARALRGTGLDAGDRVALVCDNSWEMVVAMFGIYKAGLVCVPVNTMLDAAAIAYILRHADVKHLVADSALLDRVAPPSELEARGLAGTVCRGDGPGPAGWRTLAERLVPESAEPLEMDVDGDTLVQIMYTSGTTGQPKGVMHSHASIQAALMANLVELGLGVEGEVFSCHLPLFHVAQQSMLLTSIQAGGASLIMRGFDPTLLLSAIQTHRISLLFGLPIMFRVLLEHPGRAGTDLSSLKLCLYAMAPMPRTLLVDLMDRFCSRFALCSGQTEIFTAATIFRPEQQLQRFGAYWGEASIANEVAVMDEAGQLLGPGVMGEIVYRGPNLMLGYFRDPEATQQAWRHGWHHSGDLGRWDPDGQLLFMDRIKDMIKTGGENVPSIKVEEVLLRHPQVRAAAVVGLPHARWGEAVAAFVVLAEAPAVSDDEILAHCQAHLGTFERPKAIVRLAQMPTTSTGKIQKFALRQAHLAHFEAQS